MSTYEANWESGILVTAEAVRGIGLPDTDQEETLMAPRGSELIAETASQNDAAD